MKKAISLLVIAACVSGFATAQTKPHKMKPGVKIMKGAKKPIVVKPHATSHVKPSKKGGKH